MLFRSKNKGTLTLQDLLNNKLMAQSLEHMSWTYGQSQTHAFEFLKIKEIEKDSLVLAVLLRALSKSFKFGEFIYTRKGIDILEREGPSIKLKKKYNKLFSVEKVFKRKPKPVVGKGVVIN